MASTLNKVKYNLSNVHYAKATVDADTGAITYATPVHIPGAVSISLDAAGEPSHFYADGYAYYTLNNNSGYEGDLEMALIPDQFRIDILGETTDKNGVLVESADAQLSNFALLFEFDGDQSKTRHCMYYCSASRPAVAGSTNEEEIEVQTETLTIKASPMPNGAVKGKCTKTDSAYATWYTAVPVPSFEA